jgi:uncharacterized protein (TIGR03435 family)
MQCAAIFKKAAILGCITVGVSLGQPPTFDAVSVKAVNLASHPAFGNSGGPGTTDPGRIHFCCVGMFSLLMRAYGVEIDRIAGPSWMMENMGPNLYQVDATLPAGTTKAQFQVMMQNLLAERFHLQIHYETRSFPGYDLVVAKDGPKLKVTASHPDGPLPPGPQLVTSLGRGMVRVQAQEKSIADLLLGMGRLIEQSLGADPTDFSSPKPRVIDKTGLTGKYDFTLEFACEGCRSLGANLPVARGESTGSPAPTDPLNIFVALEKQLGLKLVKTHAIPLDVIVVDRVDKIPTGN